MFVYVLACYSFCHVLCVFVYVITTIARAEIFGNVVISLRNDVFINEELIHSVNQLPSYCHCICSNSILLPAEAVYNTQ